MSVAIAAAGRGCPARLLMLLARLYRGTSVERDGRRAVALTSERLAEMLTVEPSTVRRALARLRGRGLVICRSLRWNRAPRVYVEVPRETYGVLGEAPPEHAITLAACESHAHSVSGSRSQRENFTLHDLNTKRESSNESRKVDSAPPPDGGDASSSSRESLRSSAGKSSRTAGVVIEGGQMKRSMKDRGRVKVRDAEARPADDSRGSPLSRWRRSARRLGYQVPDDPKTARHLKLLSEDLTRRGLDPGEEFPALIERWHEYRGEGSPSDPFPWAVRRRLDAYASLPPRSEPRSEGQRGAQKPARAVIPTPEAYPPESEESPAHAAEDRPEGTSSKILGAIRRRSRAKGGGS